MNEEEEDSKFTNEISEDNVHEEEMTWEEEEEREEEESNAAGQHKLDSQIDTDQAMIDTYQDKCKDDDIPVSYTEAERLQEEEEEEEENCTTLPETAGVPVPTVFYCGQYKLEDHKGTTPHCEEGKKRKRVSMETAQDHFIKRLRVS